MEQKYTTSIRFKALYGILAVVAVAFTIIISLPGHNENYLHDPALLILPLLGVIGACLVFINLYKREVIVSDSSVRYTTIWGSQKIVNEHIRGFRVTDKAILIKSTNKGYHKLAIKETFSIGNSKELIAWLNRNFKNFGNSI